MTLIKCWDSIVLKYLLALLAISMLSACGGGSSKSTESDSTVEKANWSFKWDDGSVWQ